LETTYEGTKLVKSAKFQILISRFEEIKMLEEETFGEFYSKMNDLRNSMVSLRKPFWDVKLIRKILRSLHEHFRIKVTTIEESKDLEEMKIEELVGSLQTMEFYTKFLQNTSLEPFIYRLTENLILINFKIWQVVFRWSLSCVWTVFCDRLSRIVQFFSKQDHSGRLDRESKRSTLSLLSAFVKETWNIMEHWVASGRAAKLSGRLAEPSQLVSSEIQIRVELGVA
jgi:hypothetical protein